MAAYASVISLKHTINGLLNSSSSSLSREVLELALDEAKSLQQVLERLNERSRSKSSMERVDALEGQIRDCANKLEDFLEFHELKLLEEEVSDESGDEGMIMEEIRSFSETGKRMEKEYIEEVSREEDDDDGDDDTAISPVDSGVEMVGRSEEFADIRDHLVRKMRPVDTCIYSYFGEEGTGRTIIARGVYEDLSSCRGEYFDCWAWVNVEHQQLKQVLMSIVAQVDDEDGDLLNTSSVPELSKYLYKALENRRYMIALDDVDDPELVDFLKRTSFPDQRNGSLVLITTASNDVALLADTQCTCVISARYFEESIWPSFHAVFLNFDSTSPQMEEAAKQIIKNCRSLPLSLAKVMLFLLKTDKTVEHWTKIAADKENPIFMVTDEISEVSKIEAEIQSWDMHDRRTKSIAKGISGWVDFSERIEEAKSHMQPKRLFSKMQICSVLGMAGIGKTKFARKIFKDRSVLHHFDHHVWLTLGPKYQNKNILIDILAQIYPDIHKLHIKGDDKLAMNLCAQASNKKCLIVLDDLCSKQPLIHLKCLFPNITGTTLVTTRLAKVAEYERDDDEFHMELLDEEESWCLLCQKVFAGESCPPELEKAGRVIAQRCDGLPLLIITVADQLLLNGEISNDYWNHVASGKEKSVFKNAHDQISEALLPSYQSLPQHLKPCFLYLGIFRERYEIRISNLTNHFISEGFMEQNSHPIEEDFVIQCLFELADRSLVMIEDPAFGSQIKTCRLHSVFWHLSNSQAMKNKFFNVVKSHNDCLREIMESQRRLCIRNSVLLGIKDIEKSLASNTSAHSLLCVGLFHQFPVPINFDLRLLRVMSALTIRLYEFPIEIVRLVLLRYLSLTCNGKIPTSLNNFRKLQYLIVKQYMNIKSTQNSPFLPAEIWEMKELKHLEIMGGCLPDHKSGPGLLKLSSLLDVSVESCRKKVLKWIPNLKRLGIRIELAPNDEGNYSFQCMNCISRLRKLQSLKCVVVNPHFRSAPPPIPLSVFPQSLKKLSLSGLGYPWEYMSKIGRLDKLQVLKLKRSAFIGPKWEINSLRPFRKLQYLLIEDTNLVHWRVNTIMEPSLKHLSIKHCYKLQELPLSYPIYERTQIDIIDCSPSTVAWAKDLWQCDYEPEIHLSWIATKSD